jgi:Spy/CpxP family protein refolding chaperone
MHPAMYFWHHARRRAGCDTRDESAGCGSHTGGGPGEQGGGGGWPGWAGGRFGGGGDDFGGGNLGVRRPLRFLAYKLDLDDAQVTELAAILSELKTERAQAEVDQRRTTSALADVLAAESFDDGRAQAATGERVKSAERLQGAVARALGRIHALLRGEQRAKFAYLLRTGALSI